MPSSSHRSSSGSLLRNDGENWFCTLTSAAAEHVLGLADLVGVGVADAGHLDHALVEQLDERTDGLRVRHRRVRAVELVQADGLDAEPLRARPWRPP